LFPFTQSTDDRVELGLEDTFVLKDVLMKYEYNKPLLVIPPSRAFQCAISLITLTLKPGALYVNVLPVARVLVTGTAALGVVGVLLVVAEPCIT